MEGLPFLPGNTFHDISKSKFHRSHTLEFKNGYAIPKYPTVGIGGEALVHNSLSPADLDELASFKPTLTYGHAKHPSKEEFIPAHVHYDKKILKFDAYLTETVTESNLEHFRYRFVNIYYFLEDDSIIVSEPKVADSGLIQGKMINRLRIPKDDQGGYWHWTNLNIGISVAFYGRVFRIINCDLWTANFLKSEGIVLNAPEEPPRDKYTEQRATNEFTRPTYVTPSRFDKLQQYLDYDRKVLCFFSIWDDRKFIIYYYLADDTVEVKEVLELNCGRDPFPLLLRRVKIPKNRLDKEKGYYGPPDFGIGKTITIFDRPFFIYDCDHFTKAFYYAHFGITEFAPINVDKPKQDFPAKEIPPPTLYGSLEDSLQSCLTVLPHPPKKNYVKIMDNMNKVLRYRAKLELCDEKEEEERRFIISYFLSDDTINIFEQPTCRSGRITGKFLERIRVTKPNSDPTNPVYYGPQDFAIGARITIFSHRFVITDADIYVLKFAEQHADQFPESTLESLRKKLKDSILPDKNKKQYLSDLAKFVQKQIQEWLHSNKGHLQLMFLEADKDRLGYIAKPQLKALCKRANIPVDDEVLDTLMEECTENRDGKITFNEFYKFVEA